MPPNPDYSSIFNLGTYKTKYINYHNSSRYTNSNDEVSDTFYQVTDNDASILGKTSFYLDASGNTPTYDVQVADVSGNTSSVFTSTKDVMDLNCLSSFNINGSIANLNVDDVHLGKNQPCVSVQLGSYWRFQVDMEGDLLVQYYDESTHTFDTRFKFKAGV
jgi:hypothetical protein